MGVRSMKEYIRIKVKWLYYKTIRVITRSLVPRHYRDEYVFFEELRGHTYTDLSYMEKRIRNLGHVLDKTLVFSEVKERREAYNRLVSLIEQVKDNPNHDVETISWVQKVLDEYTRRLTGEEPLNSSLVRLKNSEIKLLENVIEYRRSIRSFKPDSISKIFLYKILHAGLWAPSGCNRQNIEYLILEDKKDIQYCQKLAGEGFSFPREAPLSVVVLIDPRGYALPSQRHMAYLEGGASAQNMLLTAHSLGIGSCWLF